jgi:hypothetical protein
MKRWLRPPGFTEGKNSRRYRSLYPLALRKNWDERAIEERGEVERGEDDLVILHHPGVAAIPPKAPPPPHGQEVRDGEER